MKNTTSRTISRLSKIKEGLRLRTNFLMVLLTYWFEFVAINPFNTKAVSLEADTETACTKNVSPMAGYF